MNIHLELNREARRTIGDDDKERKTEHWLDAVLGEARLIIDWCFTGKIFLIRIGSWLGEESRRKLPNWPRWRPGSG